MTSIWNKAAKAALFSLMITTMMKNCPVCPDDEGRRDFFLHSDAKLYILILTVGWFNLSAAQKLMISKMLIIDNLTMIWNKDFFREKNCREQKRKKGGKCLGVWMAHPDISKLLAVQDSYIDDLVTDHWLSERVTDFRFQTTMATMMTTIVSFP